MRNLKDKEVFIISSLGLLEILLTSVQVQCNNDGIGSTHYLEIF